MRNTRTPSIRFGVVGPLAAILLAMTLSVVTLDNPLPVSAQTGTPSTDRAALVALYNATDGDNWGGNTNWLSDEPLGEWQGVTTNDQGRVVELHLWQNNLTGSIPSQLGNLAHLQEFQLGNNELSGEIPSELGNLSNLQKLDLGINELSGEIPAELGTLSNLKELYLQDNSLSGAMPSELGRLANLTVLFAWGNQLGGEIPSALGNLSNLQKLDIAVNELSGEIPAELGTLSNLKKFYLQENRLSGAIPSELGRLANLTVLFAWENQLSGEIPSELGNLSNLQLLSLSHNQLSGELPSLSGLLDLERLYLDGNELTGGIPSELGRISGLDILRLDRNRLSGEIPAELGSLSNLTELNLSNNELSGEIPSELGSLANLEQLALGGNQLTGEIPSELGNLSSLTGCYLWGNELSGEIPSELGNLSSLQLLSLSDNQLSGEIPSGLGNLSKLEILGLSKNQLTGSIPPELGSLLDLERLYLDGNELSRGIPAELGRISGLDILRLDRNRLSGEIPAELGSLSNLTELNLSNNELSGEIPSELASLANLQELALGGNQLSGEIPSELGNLSNLTGCYLWGNELSGEIPAELGNLSKLRHLYLSENHLSGEIPSELGDLSNLEHLALSHNDLTGAVPTDLSDLAKLELLYLYGNQLTDPLPDSLTNLATLELFAFDDNDGLCAPTDDAFQAWLQGIANEDIPDDAASIGPNCDEGPTPTAPANGYIAFTSTRDIDVDIHVMEVTNGTVTGVTRLTDAAAPDFEARWSPDGSRIAFTSVSGSGSIAHRDIYRMNSDGSDIARLTEAPAVDDNPNWSPDGNRLAFTSTRDGEEVIYVMDMDGGNEASLTDAQNVLVIGWAPSWSPDGRQIAFVSRRDGNDEIYKMSVSGTRASGITRLTNESESDWAPSWSPDGLCIAFSSSRDNRRNNAHDIYVMDADGRNVERVTENRVGDWDPSWSPDGRHIAFASERNRNVDIYLIDLTTKNETRLTSHAGDDYQPNWAPMGGGITPGPSPSHAGDRAGLVALYNATGGDNWTNNTNWMSTRPIGEWFGVTTDGGGRVTRIHLEDNNLSGVIPTELASLSNLMHLVLWDDGLTGTIPTELSNLPNLRDLGLSGEFTGGVPGELGRLQHLRSLQLNGAGITGSIPAELGNLSNLGLLSMQTNQLSGSIPSSLCNLRKLEALIISYNELTGEIPSCLGDLSNLIWLNLEENQLTGWIPPELGNLSNLQQLSLHENQLTGTIPPELGNLSSLTTMHISGNQLTGCIPSALRDVADNDFDELGLHFCETETSEPTPVPVHAGDRAALVALYNSTGGTNWTDSTNWLSDRPLGEWYGVTTDDEGRVTRLNFWSNNLTGTIPTELENLSRLTFLSLAINQLSGEIPSELGNLTKIERLNLWANRLSGSIPTELANLSALLGLTLDHNQLSGVIPPELGNLLNLEQLGLGDNELIGSIPADLGKLSNLTTLWLDKNHLTGQVPPELGRLSNLTVLWINENQLSGTIPSEFAGLTSLEEFYFDSNAGLCAPDNVDFQNWLQAIPDRDNGPNCGALDDKPFELERSSSAASVGIGESLTLSVTLRDVQEPRDHGGISISFPSLVDADGSTEENLYSSSVADVELVADTTSVSNVSFYDSGDTDSIHNTEGEHLTPEYLLIESDDPTWSQNDVRTLTLRITPQQEGEFLIRIRGWLCADEYDDCDRQPDSSDTTDQQGWPAEELVVNVTARDGWLELAEKYAPVLRMHPDEIYFPKGVEALVEHAMLTYHDPGLQIRPVVVETNLTPDMLAPDVLAGFKESLPEESSSQYDGANWYLDIPGPDYGSPVSSTEYPSPPTRTDGTDYPPKVYATIRDHIPDKVYLQYYLFYFYDHVKPAFSLTACEASGFPLCQPHEADWELIQLEFDAADVADALKKTPTRLAYSQHGWSEDSSYDEISKIEGHPVAYIAQGKHANYYGPDPDVTAAGTADDPWSLSISEDQISDRGKALFPPDFPSKYEEPCRSDESGNAQACTYSYEIELIHEGTPWVAYEGGWGDKEQKGIDGPDHPYRWDTPHDWMTNTNHPPVGGIEWSEGILANLNFEDESGGQRDSAILNAAFYHWFYPRLVPNRNLPLPEWNRALLPADPDARVTEFEYSNREYLLEHYSFNTHYPRTIPPSLGDLSRLQKLDIQGNGFTGVIPRQLGYLSNLRELYLNDNDLSGKIPPLLGDLPQLETLYLAGNDLTGCIPNGLKTVADNDFDETDLEFCDGTSPSDPPLPEFKLDSRTSDRRIEVGESFTLTAEMHLIEGDGEGGGISVSFPQLTEDGGGLHHHFSSKAVVELLSPDMTVSGVTFYQPGEGEINPADGDESFKARYLLVESAESWEQGNTGVMQLRITPTEEGVIRMLVRGWMCAGVNEDGYVDCAQQPESSRHKDQQGWPVVRLSVNVRAADSGAPDLVVSSFSVSRQSVTPGERVTLYANVYNQGDAATGQGTYLHYYRSDDGVIDNDDTEVGSDYVNVLGVGASNDEDYSRNVPQTEGTYHYYACVEELPNESDKNNNCSETVEVTVATASQGGPDLVVYSTSVYDKVFAPGERFQMSFRVQNQGGGASASAATMSYYRSEDATISPSLDERLAIHSGVAGSMNSSRVGQIAADGSSQVIVYLDAHTYGHEKDTYYYGACVQAVPGESNADNNCAAVFKVSLPTEDLEVQAPDLVVTSLSVGDKRVEAGRKFRIDVKVHNQGKARSSPTVLRYYRSGDTNLDRSTDEPVATDDVDSLEPDEYDTEYSSPKAPSSVGTHYYYACLDTVANESDTGNNCSSSVSVTVAPRGQRAPDLVPSPPVFLVWNPNGRTQSVVSGPVSGSSIILRVDVSNVGNVKSSEPTVRVYRSENSNFSDSSEVQLFEATQGIPAEGERSVTHLQHEISYLSGKYYYRACVDQVAGETNTTNNCSGTATLTVE